MKKRIIKKTSLKSKKQTNNITLNKNSKHKVLHLSLSNIIWKDMLIAISFILFIILFLFYGLKNTFAQYTVYKFPIEKIGCLDGDISKLQIYLYTNDFLDFPHREYIPSGKIDNYTQSAIINYQFSRGLLADGKFSDETIYELNKDICPTYPTFFQSIDNNFKKINTSLNKIDYSIGRINSALIYSNKRVTDIEDNIIDISNNVYNDRRESRKSFTDVMEILKTDRNNNVINISNTNIYDNEIFNVEEKVSNIANNVANNTKKPFKIKPKSASSTNAIYKEVLNNINATTSSNSSSSTNPSNTNIIYSNIINRNASTTNSVSSTSGASTTNTSTTQNSNASNTNVNTNNPVSYLNYSGSINNQPTQTIPNWYYGTGANYSAPIQTYYTLSSTTAYILSVSSTSIMLNWNNVASAPKYSIEWSTSSNFMPFVATSSTNTNFTFTDLSTGTLYYFKIKTLGYAEGNNIYNDSVYSETLSTTTLSN